MLLPSPSPFSFSEPWANRGAHPLPLGLSGAGPPNSNSGSGSCDSGTDYSGEIWKLLPGWVFFVFPDISPLALVPGAPVLVAHNTPCLAMPGVVSLRPCSCSCAALPFMSARVSCVARVLPSAPSARSARPPRASSFSRVLASSSSSFDVLFAYPSGLLPSLGLAAASRVSTFLMEVPADLETIPSRIIYRKGAFFEVRALEAYVAAEAPMESGKIAPGVVGDAVNSGNAFNTVASYIFGGNETNEAISMTTPVLSDAGAADENQRKSMRFVMAPTRVQETSTKPLPKPTNERVKLVDVPQRMVAVERFSGVATPQAVRWATEQLVENLRAVSNAYVPADEAARAAVRDGDIDALERLGVIETAQYNPPSTPPFRRTNELWLDVIVASANQV